MEKTEKNTSLRKDRSYRELSTSSGEYFAFPKDLFKLLSSGSLTNKEFLVFTVLHREAFRTNSRFVKMGFGTICNFLGGSRQRVSETIKSLENKGYILTVKDLKVKGKANTYEIKLDALEGVLEPNSDGDTVAVTVEDETPPKNPKTVTVGVTECNPSGDSTDTVAGTLQNSKVYKDILISDSKRNQLNKAMQKLSSEFEENEILFFIETRNPEYFRGIKFGFEKYIRNGLLGNRENYRNHLEETKN